MLITDKELHIVSGILQRYVPYCEVRVFGSRRDGTARTYSDLDLAIVGEGKMDEALIDTMKDAFQESDLPYRVDLLDWNTISPEFRNVIESRGFEIVSSAQTRPQ